uniref:Sulfotransferase family 4A member 1 n=1 Tax=Aotus nancymaae TaxID=37293 RepID=A0A2K5DZP2_AOTNA
MAESEAETPSTPGEFESKYFEFHGVRLPPFCRGKMEEIANFPVRPSDVWIVTYPKSGTDFSPPHQEPPALPLSALRPPQWGLQGKLPPPLPPEMCPHQEEPKAPVPHTRRSLALT